MRQGYLFIAVPGLWQPATIHYMDPLSVGVFAIVGATTFIVLDALQVNFEASLVAAFLAIFVIRSVAIHWHLALPIFDLSHDTT
jgi:uncharacterized membrane protein YeiH